MRTAERPSIDTDKPPRPKRWIPLSLRMFLAMLALLVATSALWIGVPAYRQQVAIRHLRGLGADVGAGKIRCGPIWFQRLVGDLRWEPLGEVGGLNLSDLDLTDADIACLQDLNGLEWLALNRTAITDEGMRYLGAVTTLKALRVVDTRVTDAGLVHLEGLKSLEVLSLKRTRVTGSGLKRLKALPLLRVLELETDQIDKMAIRGLPANSEPRLPGTQVSQRWLGVW